MVPTLVRRRRGTAPFAAIPAAIPMSILVALLAAAGCGGPASPRPADRPVVAVSIPPLAWFVERLAGDAVDVAVLLPPGASPEQFEPSVRERRALAGAGLLVEVGHRAFTFETGRVDPLVAERDDLPVVRAWVSGDDGGDPHVWLSPATMLPFVDRLAEALAGAAPDEAERIETARVALRGDIERLDAAIAERLAPFAGRRFFVFHPGWGAFADRYGLVQEAAEEHGAEPGPDHLAEQIAMAREEGVRTVFVQPQFAERGIRTLADDVGADVAVLDPLAPDWAANLDRAADEIAASFAPDVER